MDVLDFEPTACPRCLIYTSQNSPQVGEGKLLFHHDGRWHESASTQAFYGIRQPFRLQPIPNRRQNPFKLSLVTRISHTRRDRVQPKEAPDLQPNDPPRPDISIGAAKGTQQPHHRRELRHQHSILRANPILPTPSSISRHHQSTGIWYWLWCPHNHRSQLTNTLYLGSWIITRSGLQCWEKSWGRERTKKGDLR